jgi:hypothetical protein
MKCECCKKVDKNQKGEKGSKSPKANTDSNFLYDGEWMYCYDCVHTKKIDKNIHETERVEWDYCEHCKNIVPIHMAIGECDIMMACKQQLKHGYRHLCTNCGQKHDHGDKFITTCNLCSHYIRQLRNEGANACL